MQEISGLDRPEALVLTSMMRPLPSEHPFRVFVDGREVNPGSGVMITSPWGSWALGLRPEGYAGVLYREPQGGGALTLPWTRAPDGQLLVGLLDGNRPNMGGQVWELMGGMVESATEAKTDTQRRESSEESGMDTTNAVPLPGGPVLQDRLVYVADIHANEGVHIFHLPFPFEELEPHPSLAGAWKPKPGVLAHKREADVVFLSVRRASLSADVLVCTAIVRLLHAWGRL